MTPTDWLTLALVAVTAFYAWATFRILRANEGVVAAMREQTEAMLRPYITISVSPRVGTTLLCLEVRNTGRSPALALRMALDRPFYVDGQKSESRNMAKLAAFTDTVESFAPDAKLIFILGVGGTIFGPGSDPTLCPPVFKIHAQYRFGERAFTLRSQPSTSVPC